MKARYIRTSTPKQSNERQLKDNDTLHYIDVCSGSIPFKERYKGKQLIKDITEKNINYISVHSIDRLGRSLIDILQTLQLFENQGVTLKVDSLGLESRINNKQNQAFKMIIAIMGQVAEMERETLLERQREGIALAKAKGTYKGRLKGTKETKEEFLSKYKGVIKDLNNNISIRKTAKLNDVGVSTVQKVNKLIADNVK